MGDSYNQAEGGGVFVYLNTGTTQAPAFGEPLCLLPPSKKTAIEGPPADAGTTDGPLSETPMGTAIWTWLVGGYSIGCRRSDTTWAEGAREGAEGAGQEQEQESRR